MYAYEPQSEAARKILENQMLIIFNSFVDMFDVTN